MLFTHAKWVEGKNRFSRQRRNRYRGVWYEEHFYLSARPNSEGKHVNGKGNRNDPASAYHGEFHELQVLSEKLWKIKVVKWFLWNNQLKNELISREILSTKLSSLKNMKLYELLTRVKRQSWGKFLGKMFIVRVFHFEPRMFYKPSIIVRMKIFEKRKKEPQRHTCF